MVEYLTFVNAVKTYPRSIDNDSQIASKINSTFALKVYLNSLNADYKLKSQAEYFNNVSHFVYKFYMYWHAPKVSMEPKEEDKIEYLKWLSELPLITRPLGLRFNQPLAAKAFRLVVENWGNILALLGAGILIPRIDKNGKLRITPSLEYLNRVSDFLALGRWALENTKIKEDGKVIHQRILNYCTLNKLTTEAKIEMSYKKFEEWCDFGFF
jgi:hypothetical protein